MRVRLLALTTALSLLLVGAGLFAPAERVSAAVQPTFTQEACVRSVCAADEWVTSASVSVRQVVRVRFIIKNNDTAALTGVGFTDALPAGLLVSSAAQFNTDCGGNATYSTTAGITTLSLVNGSIPPADSTPGSGFCTLSINLVGSTTGVKVNTTGPLTTIETGAGPTATLTLTMGPSFTAGLFNVPRMNFLPLPGFPINVRFAIGGDQGRNIFAEGSPKSRPVDCMTRVATGAFEPTQKFLNIFTYQPFIESYSYVWATKRAWFGTCREFVIDLANGGTVSAFIAFTFDLGQFPPPEPD